MMMKLCWQARLAACLLATVAAVPAVAQAQATAPSDSSMVNLVRLLVEQKVITAEKGEVLMQQAEAEAAQARATGPGQQQQQAGAQLPPPSSGTIRVPYVPETVRAQIKAELKSEVLAQARTEGWATPGFIVPAWTNRITVSGDVRFRSKSNLFSSSNSDLIFDFAEINRDGPTDVLNDPIPILNTREDRRNELDIRARVGVHAQLNRQVEVGVRLATGDDASPISTNESLGGGLGKRDIWLDRAFIRLAPSPYSSISFGRFDNPFRSTDLMFDSDLGFDGVAGELRSKKTFGLVDLALRGGAFPLDFGDADYPSTDQQKLKNEQRYLFSAQAEAGWQVTPGLRAGIAGAFHKFVNMQGQLSEPCLLFAGATACSTDAQRPLFLRKGNTLSPLRQIAVDPTLPPGEVQPQPQFFGLTFDYGVINFSESLELRIDDDVSVSLVGDYVRNIAFKRGDLCRNGLLGQPVNNGQEVDGNVDLDFNDPEDSRGNICETDPARPATRFVGGNEGFLGQLTIGHRSVRKWGQWNAHFGYRYLESDAVPDALTDSDFHLGGTNARGYFIGAKMGISNGISIGGRWLSANEISGEPYAVDVLQLDLQAEF